MPPVLPVLVGLGTSDRRSPVGAGPLVEDVGGFELGRRAALRMLDELGEPAGAEALARRLEVTEQLFVEPRGIGEARVGGVLREELADDLDERRRRNRADRDLERRKLARLKAPEGLERTSALTNGLRTSAIIS